MYYTLLSEACPPDYSRGLRTILGHVMYENDEQTKHRGLTCNELDSKLFTCRLMAGASEAHEGNIEQFSNADCCTR